MPARIGTFSSALTLGWPRAEHHEVKHLCGTGLDVKRKQGSLPMARVGARAVTQIVRPRV